MNKLYTIGYAHQDATSKLDTLVASGTLIADIRLSRNTQVLGFSGDELRLRYKGTYAWVPELGNKNHYDKGADIRLKDGERGLARLDKALGLADIVLLCGCKHVECCHRLYVSLLAQKRHPEMRIEHLLQSTHDGMVKHSIAIRLLNDRCSYVYEGELCQHTKEVTCYKCHKPICSKHKYDINAWFADRRFLYCPMCYEQLMDR